MYQFYNAAKMRGIPTDHQLVVGTVVWFTHMYTRARHSYKYIEMTYPLFSCLCVGHWKCIYSTSFSKK